jgi:hypothetical protein
MASDDKIKFELDLDASGFKEGVEGAKTALENMAKTSKGLEEAIGALKEMAAAAGVLYGAFKLLQGAVNTVFEAENIKAVNQQFEILSRNAGIATETLRSGLERAAGGLIDDTELIKIANKAIVAMGERAEKLPQIMDLARKSAAAFGGDLQQNFEAITQAVSTGNLRMLKQMGIVVDSDKALRDYARSIGSTVSLLTDAERKQALLNAVLAKGETALKGVTNNNREAQNTWKQTIVTLNQIGETFTLVFDKIFGKTVRGYLSGIREIAKDTQSFVERLTGTESKESRFKRLSHEVFQLQTRMEEFRDKAAASMSAGEALSYQVISDQAKAKLEAVRAELAKTREEHRQAAEQKTSTGTGDAGQNAHAASLERIAAESRAESDLLMTKQQALAFEQTRATTVEQFDMMERDRRAALLQERDAAIRALNDRDAAQPMLEEEKQNALYQIQLKYAQQREELDRTEEQRKLQIGDNLVRNADSVGAGISAGFKQGALNASKDLRDFGLRGREVFQSFSNHAVGALQAWGAGTKTASEAAKGFIFGMLADAAEAEGKKLLLSSLWPPNPVALGAGTGLIALSGLLRSQANGSSKGVGGDVGGGGGGFGGYSAGYAPDQNVSAQEQQKKSVTIAIQGNYFDTDQTRTRLLEMIRESTDATDFKYVQIGGT